MNSLLISHLKWWATHKTNKAKGRVVSCAIEGWKTKIPSKFWNIVLKVSSDFLNLLGLVGDPFCREVCSSHPLPKIISAASFWVHPLDSDPANSPVLDSPCSHSLIWKIAPNQDLELRINTIKTLYDFLIWGMQVLLLPSTKQELVFNMVPFSHVLRAVLSTNKCWQGWSCFLYTLIKIY